MIEGRGTATGDPLPASAATRLLAASAAEGGDVRSIAPDELIARVERSGLRGRGGAGYPLAKKLAAVRAAVPASGREPLVVVNAYDADPDSPLSQTLIERTLLLVAKGAMIAAVAVGAREAIIYMHPRAEAARRALEKELGMIEGSLGGVLISIAVGPGGFMGGEESALMNLLESKRAMARQRPPYPAENGVQARPTLIASAETVAWLPQIVARGARADTKLVSVTGAVTHPGVYEVPLGTTLGGIVDEAGGATGELKGLHVGGPTGGILAAVRADVKLDFDTLKAAGTHMGSAQVRAIPAGVCIVNEAARLFAYLAKENCAICVPCRVGTKRVQGILESAYSGLGRESDLAWLDELGTHMERFSLCGFGITAPSILRTTMREFADEYRAHIVERRCPTNTCSPVRSRRYETMAQP